MRATPSCSASSPEEAKPGTTLREIVERRAAKGLYPDTDRRRRAGRFAAAHRAGRSQPSRAALATGACCRRRVQPRSDGGWVVTLHDISEQEQLKKQLQATERAARCRPQQHVSGSRHVRQRAAADRVQPSLCRDVRSHARAGEARHDRSPDLRLPHGKRLLSCEGDFVDALVDSWAQSAAPARIRIWPTAASSA